MGGRRATRSEMPPDPAAVVRALRVLREALLREVSAKTRPFGPVYLMAETIIAAIDKLADHLSGVDGYFRIGGSSASAGQLAEMEERNARERGEKPWR